jgi:hypothetical protein
MATYIRDGLQAEASFTMLVSDDVAAPSIDAAIQTLSGPTDSVATLLDEARYPEAIAQLKLAIGHLRDAQDAGADTSQLVEQATNLAFLSTVSILDEGKSLGVPEEDLNAGWESYDEASRILEEGDTLSDPLDILEMSAGFGKGTKLTTSSASAKPQLL